MFLTPSLNRGGEFDPERRARFIGFLYLLLGVVGAFSLMAVPMTVYVLDDPGATATSIAANEGLLRWGLFAASVLLLIEILICTQLYQLFRYVHRQVVLAAIFARLLMVAVQAVCIVFQGAALIAITRGETVFGMTADNAASLALMLVHTQLFGVHVWEVLFAFHCLFLGFLIYHSTFLPRLLGGLVLIASFGYGLNGFGNMLAPDYASAYLVVLSVGVLLGELPMWLWFLIKKVDAERWYAVRSLWLRQ